MATTGEMMTTECQDEAIRIIREAGMEPYILSDGIVMGKVQSELFHSNGCDYMVIWERYDSMCPGAFMIYDKFAWISDGRLCLANSGEYATSPAELKSRFVSLHTELLRIQNRRIEQSLDVLAG